MCADCGLLAFLENVELSLTSVLHFCATCSLQSLGQISPGVRGNALSNTRVFLTKARSPFEYAPSDDERHWTPSRLHIRDIAQDLLA